MKLVSLFDCTERLCWVSVRRVQVLSPHHRSRSCLRTMKIIIMMYVQPLNQRSMAIVVMYLLRPIALYLRLGKASHSSVDIASNVSAFCRWLGNPCSRSQLGRIRFPGSRRPEKLDSNRATPGVGSIFGEFCICGLFGGFEVHVDVGILVPVLDFVDVVSTTSDTTRTPDVAVEPTL